MIRSFITSRVSNKELMFLFVMLVYAASLVYSKFGLSLAMWGLAIVGALEIKQHHRTRLFFNKGILSDLKQFFINPAYSLFLGVMLVILISGLYSDNMDDWLVRFRVKIPFVIMPMAFFLLPRLQKKYYHFLLYWIVMVAAVSSADVMIKYLFSFEEINKEISRGGHLPTPCHPIRFSLYLSMSIFVGIYLLLKTEISKRSKVFLGILAVWIFVFLHVLSSRTGWLSFYSTAIFLLVFYSFKSGKWYLPFFALILGAGLLFTAYKAIPSFKSKVDYTRWDISRYLKNDTTEYSDSERILSYQAGAEIAKENFLIGTGLGDLRDAMQIKYRNKFNVDLNKRPHNQFLTFLAGAGIFGLLLFLMSFYGPYIFSGARDNILLIAIYLIASSSFLVENTIDGAVGTALILGFVLLFVKQANESS